jgi:transcriptional regulator with XRE-family HTH domain
MPVAVRIRDYDQLTSALAARRRQLGLRQLEAVDLSGCQPGYQGKIESQTRRLGPLSLPMILAALDCDLLLCPRSPTVSPVERTGSCRVVHHATTEGN